MNQEVSQTVQGNTLGTDTHVSPSATSEGNDLHHQYFRTDHLLVNLKGRTISSGAVTISAQAAKFLLTLGSTMILARLLTPRDFGLVAMVTTVTSFLRVFKDAGLSIATVQREKITQAQVSNLFWINMGVSSLGSLMLAALAWVIARFYHNPGLIPIALLLSLTFIVNGSTVQHQALLKRQMRFKALAVIEVGSMAFSVIVGITLAILRYGYWSLVWAILATEVAGLLLTWSISRWRPQLPTRGSGVGPLVSFGVHRTTGDLAMSIARGTDNLLIGRFFGAAAVGLYSRASALLVRPLEQLLGPVNAVIIPALSRLQSQPERYRSTFLRVYEAIALLAFLGAGLLLALARPLTLVLLGPKWEPAAVIFAGFTIAALSIPLANASAWLFTSQGRGGDMLAAQLINSFVTVVSYIVGLPFGPVGVALAFSIFGPCIRIPISYSFAGRRGPVKTVDLWRGFFRQLPVWAVVVIVTSVMRKLVTSFPSLMQLIICAPVGILTAVAFICFFAPQRRIAMYLLGTLLESTRGIRGKLVSVIFPRWMTQKEQVYVFGDSHAKIFSHINKTRPFYKLHFDVTWVAGATAQGMVNPNSQTNSLEVFRSKIDTITDKKSILIFLLGEVDTGFVIWYRAQKYREPVGSQLKRSIRNYLSFLVEIQKKGFERIFVLGAPLPTIKDGQTSGEIANLRREIKATQFERTELTLRYNAALSEVCAINGFTFINVDEQLLDARTGLIRNCFVNKNPNNHHLDPRRYSAVIYERIRGNIESIPEAESHRVKRNGELVR